MRISAVATDPHVLKEPARLLRTIRLLDAVREVKLSVLRTKPTAQPSCAFNLPSI
jgi:hypothetical protein